MFEEASGVSAEQALAHLERLEFRSFATLFGRTLFGIRDPETDTSFTLERGMVRHGFAVREFDPGEKVLTLGYAGATRKIPLAAARVLDLDDTGPLEIEEVQRRWKERVDEREAFNERWRKAVEELPELAELQDHLGELFADLKDLRASVPDQPTGTTAESQILRRQAEVGEEFRLMEDCLRETIVSSSKFEPDDVETFDLLRSLVRHSWPEVE